MSGEQVDTALIRARLTGHPWGDAYLDIVALCDEVDRLRATLDRVRALADRRPPSVIWVRELLAALVGPVPADRVWASGKFGSGEWIDRSIVETSAPADPDEPTEFEKYRDERLEDPEIRAGYEAEDAPGDPDEQALDVQLLGHRSDEMPDEQATLDRVRALVPELEEYAKDGVLSYGIAAGWRDGVRIAAHNLAQRLDNKALQRGHEMNWTDEDVERVADAIADGKCIAQPSFDIARVVLARMSPRVTELLRAVKVETLRAAAGAIASGPTVGISDTSDMLTAGWLSRRAAEIERGEP